jgi:hypothetical protein
LHYRYMSSLHLSSRADKTNKCTRPSSPLSSQGDKQLADERSTNTVASCSGDFLLLSHFELVGSKNDLILMGKNTNYIPFPPATCYTVRTVVVDGQEMNASIPVYYP